MNIEQPLQPSEIQLAKIEKAANILIGCHQAMCESDHGHESLRQKIDAAIAESGFTKEQVESFAEKGFWI